VKWYLVARNICQVVDPPGRQRFEGTPLALDQIHKLLSEVEGQRMETLFKLILATEMRRGELIGLKWQGINLETETIQVRRVLSRVPGKESRIENADQL
jgi:integrase